jgi:hypothetical protein
MSDYRQCFSIHKSRTEAALLIYSIGRGSVSCSLSLLLWRDHDAVLASTWSLSMEPLLSPLSLYRERVKRALSANLASSENYILFYHLIIYGQYC